MIKRKIFYLSMILSAFLFFLTGCFEDDPPKEAYVNIDQLMRLHPNFISDDNKMDLLFAQHIDELRNGFFAGIPDIETSIFYSGVLPFDSLPPLLPLIYSNEPFINSQIDFIKKNHARDLDRLERQIEVSYVDEMQSEILESTRKIWADSEFDLYAHYRSIAQQLSIAWFDIHAAEYRRVHDIKPRDVDIIREANAWDFINAHRALISELDEETQYKIERMQEEILNKYSRLITEQIEIARNNSREEADAAIDNFKNQTPSEVTISNGAGSFDFSGIPEGVLDIPHPVEILREHHVKNLPVSNINIKENNNIVKKDTIALVNLYAKSYNYIISEKNKGNDITADVEKWLKNVWSN